MRLYVAFKEGKIRHYRLLARAPHDVIISHAERQSGCRKATSRATATADAAPSSAEPLIFYFIIALPRGVPTTSPARRVRIAPR